MKNSKANLFKGIADRLWTEWLQKPVKHFLSNHPDALITDSLLIFLISLILWEYWWAHYVFNGRTDEYILPFMVVLIGTCLFNKDGTSIVIMQNKSSRKNVFLLITRVYTCTHSTLPLNKVSKQHSRADYL